MENVIYLANKWSSITEIRGGGDQPGGSFFHSIKLSMGNGELTEPYKQHIWTYACINAIATAVKSVPFIIIKEDNTNSKTRKFKEEVNKIKKMIPKERAKLTTDELKQRGFEIIEEGELYELFRDVNPLMTRSQLWESTVILRNLYGGAAWVLEGKNELVEQNEWPKEIWPWSPQQFEPIYKNGILKKWKKKQTGRSPERILEPWQLLWFWKYNPYEEYLKGFAPYEAVKNAANQDFKSSQFNNAFLENGADAGGVITVEKFLPDDKRKAMINAWEDRHSGPTNQNKTALLQGGAKYDRNPVSHRDMQFQEGKKWSRDEALAGYQVPKMMVQLYEDINMATAQMVRKLFWEQTVVPELIYYEELIDSRLFSKKPDAKGFYGMFDLSQATALREDMVEKSEVAEKFNKIGIPTADLIDMLELNVEKRPWQEVWWAPFNLTPISSAEGNTEPDEPEEPKQDSAFKFKYNVANAVKQVQKKMDKEKHWKIWVEKVLDPVEKPFQSKIKSYWYDLRVHQLKLWNEATKSIRAIPTPGELNSILFNNNEWQEKMQAMSKPFHIQAAQNSIDEVALEMGTPAWNITDPRVVEILSIKNNMIKGITNRFWNTLRESMVQGLEASETVNELSKRIRDEFNFVASPSRTLTIARTETAQVASTVRNANFKYLGVKKHEWNTAGDENVRDAHVYLGTLEAQNIDHDYMIDLRAQGLTKGSGELKFPSDTNGPPAEIINCRCVSLPVI